MFDTSEVIPAEKKVITYTLKDNLSIDWISETCLMVHEIYLVVTQVKSEEITRNGAVSLVSAILVNDCGIDRSKGDTLADSILTVLGNAS